MSEEKNPVGRPPKIVDEQLILEHASKGCTMNELAAITGVSVNTLSRNYDDVIKRGHQLRNQSLRKKQYELAMAGNPTMCIWLGKQFLDQHDKVENTNIQTPKGYGKLPIRNAGTQLGNADKPN